MNVSSDDDGISHFRTLKIGRDAASRGFVSRPGVHVEALFRAWRLIDEGHAHLIRDDVPLRSGLAQFAIKPLFLCRAQHRALLQKLGAGRFCAVSAGLIASELPAVEHSELRQWTK